MRLKLNQVKISALSAVATAILVPALAFAEPVKLSVPDGSVAITGDLISFEDGFYVVETALGTMRIIATSVVCEGEGCPVTPGGADVLVAGSDTIGVKMMPALIEGYATSQGGLSETETGENGSLVLSLMADEGFGDSLGHFEVLSTGSSDAFIGLLQKTAEIGMASRRIRPAEARRFVQVGGGDMISAEQERVIAVDSLVVIVNPANSATTITMADLDRIYSGQVTNWSQLGGRDVPIVAFSREAGSGSGSTFDARIFAKSGRSRAGAVQSVASNTEMADSVNSDIGAIGFVGYAFQEGTKQLAIGTECGIISQPDAFTAKAEEYPLARRLYLYNRADTVTETGQNFLDFAISSGADDVIAKAGFIGLGVLRNNQATMSGRLGDLVHNTVDPAHIPLMRELAVDMLQFDRLSTTFRFASGSSQIEQKSLVDLDRLIELLNETSDNIEVSLVGFSDSDGSFNANQALSVGRAQQIATVIRQLAAGRVGPNVTFTSRGYGELAPSACNTSLDGKRINRRVEVWIRKL